jgi:hypothetical protein
MPNPLVSAIALTSGLSLLFAVIGSSNTAGLSVWAAWLHWLIHIGTGLTFGLVVADLCARNPRLSALPFTLFLLMTGLLGALLFAPFASWLEVWLPQSADVDEDPLDRWAAGGTLQRHVAEFLQLAPSYLMSWFLINAGPLIDARRAESAIAGAGSGAAADGGVANDLDDRRDMGSPLVHSGSHDVAATAATDRTPGRGMRAVTDTQRHAGPGILGRLPRAIGGELVSASAELHYLEVVTTRGRATLLGRLSQLEVEMGAVGLRVHRSHWVSLAQVRRVFRTRYGWQCELRDGRRLPIARRRVSDVQDRLGRDFVIDAHPE